MDTDSFIIHVETEDFFKDIAKDVNKWFDTSTYNKNDNRPLPIGIDKKVNILRSQYTIWKNKHTKITTKIYK